jgi:hypothetical protein
MVACHGVISRFSCDIQKLPAPRMRRNPFMPIDLGNSGSDGLIVSLSVLVIGSLFCALAGYGMSASVAVPCDSVLGREHPDTATKRRSRP